MTDGLDIGPVAWRIWNAMVNGEGLPLTVFESDLIELTENEALTLSRTCSRKGLTVERDPISRAQTIYRGASA